MRPLTTDLLRSFLAPPATPCVSLYQPTHRANPDNLQDPIRFKNLVRDAERSLREAFPAREAGRMMERFHALADDYQFWIHQHDGLAVLAAGDTFEVFRLQRPVKELVVVADSFHLKPLLRIVQSADRFHVLCLDRHKAALFEGNRDALDEVDTGDMPATIEAALGSELTEQHLTVASYGAGAARAAKNGAAPSVHGHGGKADEVETDQDRFFRVIDREVLARYSRPSGLPLVLAALPQYHAEFRRVSHNPFLQPDGVAKNPWPLDADRLRAEAWKAVEPKYQARLARLTDDHRAAAARGLAASDVKDVGRAVVAARIGVLLVEADRTLPGRFDKTTGEIRPARLADPAVDDVLDDLAEAVLRGGGDVVVVPPAWMPSGTGLAATFRY